MGDKEVVKDNAAGVGVGLRAVVVDKAEDLWHDEDRSTCCVEELVTEVLKEGREAKVEDFDVANGIQK